MKNAFFSRLVAMLLVSALFWTCAKDEPSPWEQFGASQNQPADPDPLADGLNAADAAIVDALPEAPDYTLHNIILPNGWRADDFLEHIRDSFAVIAQDRGGGALGPQDAKNALIAKMAGKAIELCDDSQWQFPIEGSDKPAQNGLAYALGGKNHTVRKAPTDGLCTDKVYGLDCSGFLQQLFLHAGLDKMPAGTADIQRQEATLRTAFAESLGGNDKFKVKEYDQTYPTSKYEAGDIVYWFKANGTAKHIGIVLEGDDGGLAVYQSNGSGGYDANNNPAPATECPKNLSDRRGPRKILLSDAYWFGGGAGKFGMSRLVVDISGKWKFRFRCESQPFDAVVLDLDFADNFDFTVTKNYPDYDGDALITVFHFVYNQDDNTLSCNFKTAQADTPSDISREDEFSVRLDRDDTGYVPPQILYLSGTGCDAEVRLINLE